MKDNRTVLITGAAGGVGTLLVERFLANNDKVIATDNRKDVLDAWRERFPKDAKIVTTPADIAEEADCAALADLARAQGGTVDVLINCAGYFPIVPFEKMTSGDWRKVIDTNLTGTFLVCAAILPLMKESGWGRIINFGSGSMFQGTVGQAHYVAAKAGVVGFSRCLAREVGHYGITVNVITPGLTVTKAVKDSFPPEALAAQRGRRAIQRDEVPEDLVGPVFFLASPDSDFMSGQIVNVDGGNNME